MKYRKYIIPLTIYVISLCIAFGNVLMRESALKTLIAHAKANGYPVVAYQADGDLYIQTIDSQWVKLISRDFISGEQIIGFESSGTLKVVSAGKSIASGDDVFYGWEYQMGSISPDNFHVLDHLVFVNHAPDWLFQIRYYPSISDNRLFIDDLLEERSDTYVFQDPPSWLGEEVEIGILKISVSLDGKYAVVNNIDYADQGELWRYEFLTDSWNMIGLIGDKNLRTVGPGVRILEILESQWGKIPATGVLWTSEFISTADWKTFDSFDEVINSIIGNDWVVLDGKNVSSGPIYIYDLNNSWQEYTVTTPDRVYYAMLAMWEP